MRFKTMLWDLDKVLIDFDRKKTAIGIKNDYPNLPLSIKEIHWIISESPEGITLLNKFETGTISAEAYRREIEKRLSIPYQMEEDFRFWANHTSVITSINSELVSLLQYIRDEHMDIEQIIAVTDVDRVRCVAVLMRLFLETGIRTDYLFDHVLTSFKVGYQKPHPAVWQKAQELAKCEPRECIFIDDLAQNVVAAQDYGFTALRYESDILPLSEATQFLRRKLRNLGFRV